MPLAGPVVGRPCVFAADPHPTVRLPLRPANSTQRIQARLLFVAEQIVEFCERGPHRLCSC
jgi:hypothetical protein